ncbi:MAG: 30S ribosomal protein S12 methylthiotransferase RimO [Chitinophagales bacterium]|nr:30S ribosomal protein S12 methylthiotransferase RimO [Chitinophagales bacterium]MDW8274081.1 30S ribosomal protein S12 methylthiotransferase RimO [Chitinophagales bacterium]
MKTKSLQEDKISIITLGCSKNVVDSEHIMTHLSKHGYDVVHDKWHKGRNIVIINTCGFVEKAKEESINTILEFAEAKNAGKIEKLYVSGCLSARYKEVLEKEIPEVDAFFGTNDVKFLLKALKVDYRKELLGERLLSTPKHYAYLKISEGCNRTCSFCAIPLMRGKHISKSIEEVVAEAQALADQGVSEIVLIAQELTYYGLDVYRKRKLPDLLYRLNDVTGIKWIRLHYAYPAQFPLELLDAMTACEKVCKYLDMPLQHASDKVLLSMRRNISQEEMRSLINLIREKIPDITLRTTMLVGYPGEEEEDFDMLCRFVEEMQFDRMGVFTYSHEEGTRAYVLTDNIPQSEKERRASFLMDIQEHISLNKNLKKIGQATTVLIDKKESGFFIGRTEADSPEVDNEVLIKDKGYNFNPGDFVQVKIIDAEAFDLHAEPLSDN